MPTYLVKRKINRQWVEQGEFPNRREAMKFIDAAVRIPEPAHFVLINMKTLFYTLVSNRRNRGIGMMPKRYVEAHP